MVDNDARELLLEEFLHGPEARRQYARELLNARIALQIKTLRERKGCSQEQLAEYAGKHQSQISQMEQVDFSGWKVSTLLKLADAFDLALVVQFEGFGKFADEILKVDRKSLERLSYAEDPLCSSAVERVSTPSRGLPK